MSESWFQVEARRQVDAMPQALKWFARWAVDLDVRGPSWLPARLRGIPFRLAASAVACWLAWHVSS